MLKTTLGFALVLSIGIGSVSPASGQDTSPPKVPDSATAVPSSRELMKMASALADQHRFDESIVTLNLALKQEPENGEIFANRALAYAWVNRVDEASSDLRQAEQLLPDCAILHRVRAIIANRHSDENTELDELSKSLEFEPSNPFALRFRASIYQRRHLYQAALADADMYIRSAPAEPAAYQMKAQLLGAQRRWPEARAVAELLELRFSEQPRALASAAKIDSDSGDRAEALATIDRALQLDGGSYHFWDMKSGMRRWDDFNGRQADLDKAIKLAPGDLGLITKLGLLAFSRARWADAKDQFTQVLDQDSKDFGVLTYRAMAFLQLGERARALADYNSALAVASGPDDLSMSCRLFAMEGLALDWGLAACERALTAKPGEPSYLVNRGLTRLRLGDVTGAYTDFDQAILKDPDSGEAYYGRAITDHRMGKAAKAAEDRQTALAITPTIEEDFCAHGMSELLPQGYITKKPGIAGT
jgi:tetratricopeptide (TPR) repeat protein